jgi:hypothetical protein
MLLGALLPVDDGVPGTAVSATLPGMAIEVVPAQLYALAAVLDAAAVSAARGGGALTADPVGGPLTEAVAGFCETAGTTGRCLAGELSWLGGAVAAAADSWLGLDGSLLSVPGRGVPE